jgi:hypothetical protein
MINCAFSDHLVLVDDADTTPGFLAAKLGAGANILFTIINVGGDERLIIAANVPPGSSDHKVLVDGADTTAAFLGAKLAAGTGISLTTLNPGGNEQVQINVTGAPPTGAAGGDLGATYPNPTVLAIEETSSPARLAIAGIPDGTILARSGLTVIGVAPTSVGDHKVQVTAADTTPDYLFPKLAAGALIALAVLNPAANEDVEIGIAPSATNGQAIITIGGVPTWSTNFQGQSLFTTGNYYAGSTTTNGEALGSVVAVQTGSASVRGIVSAQHSTDINSARFVGMKSRGTRAAPTIIVNGDTISRFVAMGYDGANYIGSAEISFEAIGVVAAGSVPQGIIFRTGTTGAPNTKFSILSGATYNVKVNSAMEVEFAFAVHGTAIATPVSASGDIRLRSAGGIFARNAANSADFRIIDSDASNNVQVGQDTVVPAISLRATTTILGVIGGVSQFTVNTTRFEITTPAELSFARGIASPVITQQPRIVVGTAQDLWMHAQSVNAAGGNGTGGRLLLTGGKPDGTLLPGTVQLSLNLDDTAANTETMVEVAEVATGRRVLALVRTQVITTTQMPANTGDGVIYVADAQTNPTGNPVTGHIYYSDQSRPAWRFNGINLRLDGTSATATAGGGAAVPANVAAFLQIDIGGTTFKIPYFAA